MNLLSISSGMLLMDLAGLAVKGKKIRVNEGSQDSDQQGAFGFRVEFYAPSEKLNEAAIRMPRKADCSMGLNI